jgi:hypothetical protein
MMLVLEIFQSEKELDNHRSPKKYVFVWFTIHGETQPRLTKALLKLASGNAYILSLKLHVHLRKKIIISNNM